MHFLLRILALASVLMLPGCGLFGEAEEAEREPELSDTYFSATVNGDPWKGDPEGRGLEDSERGLAIFNCRKGKLRLGIQAGNWYEDTYPYHESINFTGLYQGKGAFTLDRELSSGEQPGLFHASYYENDGDVGIASYSPTEDSLVNQVAITNYFPERQTEVARDIEERGNTGSTGAGVIEGTFQTVLVVDPDQRVSEEGEPARRQPDTLRFTEGRFKVGAVQTEGTFDECGLPSEVVQVD